MVSFKIVRRANGVELSIYINAEIMTRTILSLETDFFYFSCTYRVALEFKTDLHCIIEGL